MDHFVHCARDRNATEQGFHDGSNGLPMQETSSSDYHRGYQSGLQTARSDSQKSNQPIAACLL